MTTAELVENSKQNQETQNQSAYAAANHAASNHAALFDEREAGDLRSRWQNIQGSFVDDPQASVAQADQLVATAIQRLAEIFAHEKANLESAWSRDGAASTAADSTEDMRQALRRYRSFFDRILSV